MKKLARQRTTRRWQHRSGVALVTVLMMTGVASALAYHLIQHQSVSLRHAELHFSSSRLHESALAIEALAIQAVSIADDIKTFRNAHETLKGMLARKKQIFPDLTFNIQIIDLSSRFNVNALVGPQRELIFPVFQRLCSLLEIDSRSAGLWVDWIDADQRVSPLGAEDSNYLLLEPAFRTPNRFVADLSELLVPTPMRSEDFRQMQRFLVALPTDALALNINTVNEPILLAFDKTDQHRNQIDEVIASEEFEEVVEAIALLPFLEPFQQSFSTSSQFVRFEISVVDYLSRVDLESSVIIHHQEKPLFEVFKRDFGVRYDW